MWRRRRKQPPSGGYTHPVVDTPHPADTPHPVDTSHPVDTPHPVDTRHPVDTPHQTQAQRFVRPQRPSARDLRSSASMPPPHISRKGLWWRGALPPPQVYRSRVESSQKGFGSIARRSHPLAESILELTRQLLLMSHASSAASLAPDHLGGPIVGAEARGRVAAAGAHLLLDVEGRAPAPPAPGVRLLDLLLVRLFGVRHDSRLQREGGRVADGVQWEWESA